MPILSVAVGFGILGCLLAGAVFFTGCHAAWDCREKGIGVFLWCISPVILAVSIIMIVASIKGDAKIDKLNKSTTHNNEAVCSLQGGTLVRGLCVKGEVLN